MLMIISVCKIVFPSVLWYQCDFFLPLLHLIDIQGSCRAWKTWKTWKNTLILPPSGKSQGKKLGIEESQGKVGIS